MQPVPEYPDTDQQLAYGALAFLYMRAPKYDRIALRDIRLLVQPPVDLRFYHVEYIEGVPRAAITWAFLSEAAEAKLIGGQMNAPAEWASGDRAWIMEVIAPYQEGNLGARITKGLLAALRPETKTIRFPRYAAPGQLRHVTEYRRRRGNKWTSKRIAAADFSADLK